jgi:hypothetical protein
VDKGLTVWKANNLMGCYWRGLCAECARRKVEMRPGETNWNESGAKAPERGHRKGQLEFSMMVRH